MSLSYIQITDGYAFSLSEVAYLTSLFGCVEKKLQYG